VRIIHDPYLTAWHEDMLYLEANEPLEKWSASKPSLKKQVEKELRKIAKQHHATVDWNKVDRVIQRADGIPTPVLVSSPDIADISKQAVQLAHPGRLHGQPVVAKTLSDSDWAMLVATFNNETEAQQLAAMLNHQGPPIPARKVQANNAYQVVAGPFKNQKEAKAAASRLRFDFEIEAKLLKPLRPKDTSKLSLSDS
jgi:L,D-transpeptidase ErfK/SrfK